MFEFISDFEFAFEGFLNSFWDVAPPPKNYVLRAPSLEFLGPPFTDPGPVTPLLPTPSGSVPDLLVPFLLKQEELQKIMPHLSPTKLQLYFPHLSSAMQEFKICTPLRAAAFLAQVAHESAEFKYMQEIASGEAYEGRKDLGNTQPGDGRRYKGRGPIQLTGRKNYQLAGKALGADLENNPVLAADPKIAFRTAGWFWQGHHLNELADAKDFKKITRVINGGYNGLKSREEFYVRAISVLC